MKYKTEIVIEAIRLKEAGVTTSAISKKLLAPSSTINGWLKKAKQNNLTAENLRSLSEQDIEEILRPRSWSRQNVILPDYEDLLVKASAPKMTVQNVYLQYLASVPEGCEPVSKATFLSRVKTNERASLQGAPRGLFTEQLYSGPHVHDRLQRGWGVLEKQKRRFG